MKDPSELYIRFGKEAAVGKIQKALKTARKIDLDHLDGEIPEAIKGAPVSLRQPEGGCIPRRGSAGLMRNSICQRISAAHQSS